MRVLGMLSGTSVDAIDLAVVSFEDGPGMRLLWSGEFAWDKDVRSRILDLLPPATSTVEAWCRVETEVGREFGRAAAWAIAEAGAVDLIASHGQTLYHWVEDGRARGSLQVGNPAWIHAATGTPVVSDFRSADIAASGQGAPLACTLDELWLGDRPSAALNLGGIANVTFVGTGATVTGDTGPANCLLDAAAQALLGRECDRDGEVARTGRVDERALERLMADPFFAQPLPRSTGREYFHADYVRDRLGESAPEGPDLFATLTEFTARIVADVVNATRVERVVISGGGARNGFLVERLEDLLDAPLVPSGDVGLPSDAKEAVLFALLGFLSATGRPGVVPGRDGRTATGAERPVVLGSLTPPSTLAPGRWPLPLTSFPLPKSEGEGLDPSHAQPRRRIA